MDIKKVLITGASEGIGRVFARKLASEGFQVKGVARNEARLKGLMAELGTGAHSYLTADLSTKEGIDKVSAELAGNHYDLLINNAGIGIYGKFYETPLSKLQAMTRLNCDAVTALSHAFLNKAQKGDALINVASGLAFLHMAGAGLYSATRSFVATFSETLWYEQRKRGIYVMGLCPGVTATNFHTRSGGGKDDVPPKAITQTPEQVVDKALKALKKRNKPIVLSGAANTFMVVGLTRLLSK